jgi:cytochrome d ubiquinol oxidase subunit II
MIEFWTAALALTIFLYLTLDGFDLGVGMLLPLVSDGTQRRDMLAAIAPVWDGNETWLVLNATILFGIFPLTYATLLSAFYLPLSLMLAALIFRGVAFEFREGAARPSAFWDKGFIVGSYLAAFLQGVAIGALARGLPMVGDRYVGGAFGWLSPFAILCGVGLCLEYALMGAAWLAYKSAPGVRDLSFRLMPKLLIAEVVFVGVSIAHLHGDRIVAQRWADNPVFLMCPAVGVLARILLLRSLRAKRELLPFLCAVVAIASTIGMLALSFYPYMIPYGISINEAAAPYSSQSFLFWGAGVFVLPLTLIYTLVIYFVFKGKVGSKPAEY